MAIVATSPLHLSTQTRYSPNPLNVYGDQEERNTSDKRRVQEYFFGKVFLGPFYWEDKDSYKLNKQKSSFVVHGDECLFPSFLDLSTTTQLELFSVIIHDDVDENHLCGNFYLQGCFCHTQLDLFRRKKPEEDINIFTNEEGQKELVMAGPTVKSLLAVDPVTFYMKFGNAVNNKYCDYVFDFCGGSRQQPAFTYVYNTFFSAILSRKGLGSVTVNYAVYDNPVAAKVEVRLLRQDNTSTTNGHHVSGVIYAENAHHKKRTCLFYKNEEKPCVLVPDGKGDGNLIIPLSKSIVAVPNISKLIIHLDLKHSGSANTGGLSSVKHDAIFSIPPVFSVPTTPKDGFMRIPDVLVLGNNIQVIVTWAGCYTQWDEKQLLRSQHPTK